MVIPCFWMEQKLPTIFRTGRECRRFVASGSFASSGMRTDKNRIHSASQRGRLLPGKSLPMPRLATRIPAVLCLQETGASKSKRLKTSCSAGFTIFASGFFMGAARIQLPARADGKKMTEIRGRNLQGTEAILFKAVLLDLETRSV